MWDEVKNGLARLPQYRELVRRLAQERASVDVCGLNGSARSLVLATLLQGYRRPALIIAPDPVKARDIVEDLGIFGLSDVVSFPEDEILPYDYHDPDRDLTGFQMRALEAMAGSRCAALVCTLRSFLKKVFPPDTFRGLLIDLESGGEHDMFELASRLVDLGYERHGIVEAKGQFAIRGGILDIFEVGEEMPVRMEFDGDEISSMRSFDIETQRSSGNRSGLRIRPLHHLVTPPEGIAALRSRLERETEGMTQDERARVLLPVERLERGISFFGMEHYAASLHELAPIFSYFDREPLIVLYDADDIETLSVEFREEVSRRYERSKEEGRLYPPPGDVFVSEEEYGEWAGSRKRIGFRSLGWERAVRFGCTAAGDYRRNLKGLIRDVARAVKGKRRVFLFCLNEFQRDRAEELLSDVALEIDFPVGGLSSGFRWDELGVLFLSEEEVFGRYHRPYAIPRARSRSLTYDPSHFKPGDFVVHVSHGIGRYMGLRVLEVEGGQSECIDIRYIGDDHLFIPVSQLRLVEKYAAAEGTETHLDRLGGVTWTRTREKARKSAEKIARDLVEIYAVRHIAKGFVFEQDKPWQREIEASFPYEETAHQLQATAEVKRDMEDPRPMDRLLCGDVGFGKTEVAIRAAFKAVMSGKQAAFLVPTTVLAMQHYHTITDRLQGFPVNVAMLSRFITAAKQRKVVEAIAAGTVDVVVGTHRLLSGDVRFKDLGLAIIDEEHRFGVRHKESFKKMKKSIDVLSMTATPIPRTFTMAISSIRDISIIDTPPRNRLPIHTEILPFDDERIRDAIMREVDRGGQVFFVHNRVRSIAVMEGYLKRLLPDRVRVAHAHGQMRERELEKRMIDFLECSFDVLVCTMIIEAGLDFQNVNTIIIDRADTFGLAQLYQLRGRVGRSDRKAYAYLLVPRGRMLTDTSVKRLQAISEFDYLGAGYRIAMRDLEIRGAGNLLGHQQSGHISAVGLDLYTRMMRDEIARLRKLPVADERAVTMSLPLEAYFPESYISDSEERMDLYRRLMRVESAPEAEDITRELRDRFGPVPRPAVNMLAVVGLKARARNTGIETVEAAAGGSLKVVFYPDRLPGKRALAMMAGAFSGRLTFHAEDGFRVSIRVRDGDGAGGSSDAVLDDIESLLNLLESCDI